MRFLLFFFYPVLTIFASSTCYFVPPPNWKPTDPKKLSPFVQIAYARQAKDGLSSSINIAKEPTQGTSQKEYVDLVKALHTANPATSWRRLGKFQVKAGVAELAEISVKNATIPVKMLQFLLVKDGYAYIMTAASSAEEFPQMRKIFTNAFRTFTITDDLVKELNNPSAEKEVQLRLAALQRFVADKSHKKEEKEQKILGLYEYLVNTYEEQGDYWTQLVIKEALESD